ncbi:MAG: Gfo/Idh/MocA family oxidoreductase [Planctomycetota bacterium]
MIRLGVMGHGGRISGMIKSVFRQVAPDLRVVGVVDPDEPGARSRLAECDQKDAVFYKNVKEMVRGAKPDALAVGTRCHLHSPYGVEAAKYDLPLFLEKPVAISMKQAVDLERAFEKSRCEVVVSFPLRVSPLCILTRQYIEDGAVGSPEHILGVNYVPYGMGYFDGGYRNFKITQGLFLQKATHDFDYMSYLMGSNIVRVAAMWTLGRVFGGKKASGLVCSKCKEAETCLESPENRKRNASGGTQSDHPCTFGIDCGTPKTGMNEDSSSAVLEFASGVHGAYTQVFYSRRDAGTRGATISGYHGTVSFDWYKNELKRVRHHQPFTDAIKAGAGLSHFGGDAELARDFIGIIQGKAKSRTPIWTGIQSAYACLAAKESAEKGKFVKVRQVGD